MTTTEKKVSSALLQRPVPVRAGGRTYYAAPPSIATLVLVSEAISRLPSRRMDVKDLVSESLAVASSCRPLGDIAALLILGARRVLRESSGVRRWWRVLLFRRGCLRRLSDRLLCESTPSELNHLIADVLKQMELADFFALTTFLGEINLTRPTIVEKSVATACGPLSRER